MSEPIPQPRVGLSFEPAAIALLLEGLGKLPIERALPLYLAIQSEAEKQLKATDEIHDAASPRAGANDQDRSPAAPQPA